MLPSVVILAGGPATRLYPVTKKIPKAMLEVAGKPFIAHQLNLLKKNDISRAIICAGYLGEQIQDFVKDSREFGLSVDFSFDGNALLGTGGALKNALALLDDVFFVMYGDTYLNINFRSVSEYFFSHSKNGLMTVFKNNNKWDKSNVVYKRGTVVKYDKKDLTPDMQYIDYGLSILKKEVFMGDSHGKVFDLADVYKDVIKEGQMLGYEVKERFFEIGSLRGLGETVKYLQNLSG
jgi:NDP-sugar pyrophosphorylase family protein